MSGGVDSSVAAALMVEQGYDCAGITLKLYKDDSRCCSPQDIYDAREVASRLGIPHQVCDFSRHFAEEVICHFIETYGQGATPNPCIECNRRVKFNLSLLRSHAGEFDCLATGHYAQTEQDKISGRFLLKKSVDTKKDQSYVLYSLSQEQLKCARFPLGGLSKADVRKIAEDRKMTIAAKGESQDICFVPDGDYGAFIEASTGKIWPPGDIIDLEGNTLGRHRGIIRYTIGQRRGLGIAANTPVYVTAKSAGDNTVTLGPDSALYSKSLFASDINLVACARIDQPMRVTVKTRYLQTEQPAVVRQSGENTLHIEFDSPQRAITPGQAAVMYDGDIVIGGGTIMADES